MLGKFGWLLLLICLSACGNSPSAYAPSECPHWGIDVVAPKYMEAWVEALYVKDDRGNWTQIPVGVASELGQTDGWDQGNWAANMVRLGSTGAPMEIYVRWQSLAEPQTYNWRFAVPESVRQMLRKHETVVWQGKQAHACRSNINLGVAPGGHTVVWLNGLSLPRVEVQRGQGTVEPLGPYQGFSRGKYRPMHEPARQYVEVHGIPYGSW